MTSPAPEDPKPEPRKPEPTPSFMVDPVLFLLKQLEARVLMSADLRHVRLSFGELEKLSNGYKEQRRALSVLGQRLLAIERRKASAPLPTVIEVDRDSEPTPRSLLENLEERAKEATPGPRVQERNLVRLEEDGYVAACVVDGARSRAEAGYIAACSPDTILRIAEWVRELEADREEAQRTAQEWCEQLTETKDDLQWAIFGGGRLEAERDAALSEAGRWKMRAEDLRQELDCLKRG